MLQQLEGITYEEWKKIKFIIDNRFYEIQNQSTFSVNESTLNELKFIS